MPLKEDFTGQQIGKLKILKRADYNTAQRKILWECQCECCGKTCLKTRDYLTKKSHLPKACSLKCAAAIPIGTKINYLTIIETIFEEGKETSYKCKCDCGNIIIVKNGTKLKNNSIKSCGCYRSERMSEIAKENNPIKDLTNQRFGKVVALEPTNEREFQNVVWKCLCDCGKICYINANSLQTNNRISCPNCKIISKGELKIKQLLLDNNLSFNSQQTFEDCRFQDTNALARFDFYVEDKYLIEFDGQQHFEYTNNGWNTKENYLKIKEHDIIKNKWCIENNIPLIRIPYTILDSLCIDDIILEKTKYLIKGE